MLRLPQFRFHQARTLADAAAVLAGEGAAEGELVRLVAGGTDLWPNMKRRHQSATAVVSLMGIPGLAGVDVNGEVHIGATTLLADVVRHPAIQERYPALAEAVNSISSPPLRHMGTLGGNLCVDTRCTYYNQTEDWRRSIDYCMKAEGKICWVATSSPRCWAHTASDSAPMLCALGAKVKLLSTQGERAIPLEDLYRDDGISYLTKRQDEILRPTDGDTLDTRSRKRCDRPRKLRSVVLGPGQQALRALDPPRCLIDPVEPPVAFVVLPEFECQEAAYPESRLGDVRPRRRSQDPLDVVKREEVANRRVWIHQHPSVLRGDHAAEEIDTDLNDVMVSGVVMMVELLVEPPLLVRAQPTPDPPLDLSHGVGELPVLIGVPTRTRHVHRGAHSKGCERDDAQDDPSRGAGGNADADRRRGYRHPADADRGEFPADADARGGLGAVSDPSVPGVSVDLTGHLPDVRLTLRFGQAIRREPGEDAVHHDLVPTVGGASHPVE